MDSKSTVESLKPNWALLAGLRFVLAMIVFDNHLRLVGGSHLVNDLLSSGAAVSGFFVISGISIAASLHRDEGGFYERRFYRVWPLAMLSIIMACLPWALNGGTFTLGTTYTEAPPMWQIMANALCLQPIVCGPLQLNTPLWSLGVEVFYYIVAPYYARLSGERRMQIIYASVAVALYCTWKSILPHESRLFWPHASLFWLWGLGYELYHRRGNTAFQVRVALLSMIAGNGLVLGGGWAGLTFAGCLALIFRQNEIHFGDKWKRLLTWLGELSYPIYILHDPVMELTWNYWPAAPLVAYYILKSKIVASPTPHIATS